MWEKSPLSRNHIAAGIFFPFKSMFASQKRVKKIFLSFVYTSYHMKEPLLTGEGSQEKK